MVAFLRDVCLLLRGRNDLGEPLNVDAEVSSDNEAHGRYARGNVAIQSGSFLSVEEMERQRATLARVHFPA